MGPLLDVMRSCNVALRWRLLHRTRKHVARGDDGVDAEKLITLLLKTSQLEYKLKQMFQSLLDTKSEKWEFCKNQARRPPRPNDPALAICSPARRIG